MLLSIGDKRFQLSFRGCGLPSEWQKSYSRYVVHGNSAHFHPDVEILFLVSDNFDNSYPLNISRVKTHHVSRADVAVSFARGFLERIGNRYVGEFEIATESDFSLYIVLKTALSMIADDTGGTLLHASGVYRDGQVWVFSGPSGSGKSTIAVELNGNGIPFAEDQILLKWDEHIGLMAYATPLRDSAPSLECPVAAPVARIVFIEQADAVRIETPRAHQAVSLFFRNSRWHSNNNVVEQNKLDLVGKIMAADLCRMMYFPKTDSFWDILMPAGKK